MNAFILLCIFLSFIFGASSESLELIQLYKDTKRFYQRDPKNAPFDTQFMFSYRKLKEIILNYLRKDVKELFIVLAQCADRQITHFFFGEIISSMSPEYKWDCNQIWREHLDPCPKTVNVFFERSFSLIDIVCRYNLEIRKSLLLMILPIQNRYLCHLKADKDKIEVAGWINEFGLIAHTLQWNPKTLLKIYEKLLLMADKYEGYIPCHGEDEFLVSILLILFKIYREQFYIQLWEELDDYKFTAISRELLYLVLIKKNNDEIFEILKFSEHTLRDFGFTELFGIYNIFLNTQYEDGEIEYIGPAFQHPQFIPFLRYTVKTKGIHNNLSKRQLWFIECFLYILPILKWEKPEYPQFKPSACVLI
jgi:hypothetical protein